MKVNIGTAGWSIPAVSAEHFASEGTALERYAARFPVTEINSSFHRPHRLSTWERWRDSVPDDFRFSVKIPKTITHQAKLVNCADLLTDFLPQAEALGSKLAVLLVQLPPKLAFDAAIAAPFFKLLRSRTAAALVCEPRHPSWFEADAEALLAEERVARVAADPAICETASRPGGWRELAYWRLHGSPVIYRSSYADRLGDIARSIRAEEAPEAWCIFDNTASSAATGDALSLMDACQE
ncbi:DUF72 domain-containing protein [Sphingomonas piscis]|uniref:DUF72 domain-containing protein n=1 Tax=Sphingomonas piscis TaxID=2714943 RepID=A0A6G7YRJ6_9SPHN|nr:DUF72 domain-containing protein [Sphingomonas piscis]QIK79365.1 DUF72 domain-containing protein [Sphingomonas piscis]